MTKVANTKKKIQTITIFYDSIPSADERGSSKNMGVSIVLLAKVTASQILSLYEVDENIFYA